MFVILVGINICMLVNKIYIEYFLNREMLLRNTSGGKSNEEVNYFSD